MSAERVDHTESNGSNAGRLPLLGWLLLALDLGYVVYAYYGLGPPPGGMPTEWWHPRTFMLDWPGVGGWVDAPLNGMLALAAPAALIAFGVFWFTRSAIARALAISSTLVVAGFALSGFAALGAWELFSWRWSSVMVLIGLCLGSTLAAPLLAAAWLKRIPLVRAAIYLPIFAVLTAAVRGATGTSEKLMFLVSPWPVFTKFGLEFGLFAIVGVIFALAIGVVSLSNGLRGNALAWIGAVTALLLPGAWIALGISSIPISAFVGITVATAVVLGIGLITRSSDRAHHLRMRGLHLAVGATLAFLPVFSGQALATGDRAHNQFVRAPKVIDALQRHIQETDSYPPTLQELVDANYINEFPRPRIGFGWLSLAGITDSPKYRYNEYGSSFVLEFDSTFWIQCAYSGNHYYDDEELDEEDEEFREEQAANPWTCLEKPPPLADDNSTPEDEDEDYDEDD